jgi:hypothetical protein
MGYFKQKWLKKRMDIARSLSKLLCVQSPLAQLFKG